MRAGSGRARDPAGRVAPELGCQDGLGRHVREMNYVVLGTAPHTLPPSRRQGRCPTGQELGQCGCKSVNEGGGQVMCGGVDRSGAPGSLLFSLASNFPRAPWDWLSQTRPHPPELVLSTGPGGTDTEQAVPRNANDPA